MFSFQMENNQCRIPQTSYTRDAHIPPIWKNNSTSRNLFSAVSRHEARFVSQFSEEEEEEKEARHRR